jgi:hypothetical protein
LSALGWLASTSVAAFAAVTLASGSSSADVWTMPTLTATNPGSGMVDLTWSGFPFPSPYVILWQDGFDTLRPNTGHTELTNVSAGVHVYDVCEPGATQDVCTLPVSLSVR